MAKRVEPDTHCNATLTRKKKLCEKEAGWGTWHPGVGRCKLHGGANPDYTAEVERLRAKQAVHRYGLPSEIDPQEALIDELSRTYGHVRWLQIMVDQIEEDDLTGPVGTSGASEGKHYHPRYEPNVILKMYKEERRHYVAIAKACVEAGIEERRVRLAEEQGQLIATAIQGILRDLKIDMTDPQVPKVVRKHLTLLEGGQEAQAA